MRYAVLFTLIPLFLLVGVHPVLAAVGDACSTSDPAACLGTNPAEFCDASTNTCQSAGGGASSGILNVAQGGQQAGQGTSPTPGQSSAGGGAGSAASSNSNTNTGFVSLTQIPGIDTGGNQIDLPGFLNQIYKICIGLAALLAVLQLVRAGIMYMGDDSVTEKSAARNLIAQSLLGLLLVLSPIIVFSIINPKILSLQIRSLGQLSLPSSSGAAGQTSGASAACNAYTNITAIPPIGGIQNACTSPQKEVDASCCAGIQSDFTCCGTPTN